MAGKFELYKDKAGEFRFRLLSKKGANLGASEGYKSKSAAVNGIESVKKNAPDDGQYAYKEGKDGKTYFNLKAKNHQVILSSQGFSSSSEAENSAKTVAADAPKADVVEA